LNEQFRLIIEIEKTKGGDRLVILIITEILRPPFQTVNAIINGRKAITSRTARELEAALGPSAELWLNLETS
jgi:plasmid maintenance system antidote protein VapI